MSRKPPWVHSRKTNSRYAGMSVPYTTCAATQPVSPGFVPSDTDRNYHLPAPFPAKDGMIPAYPCKAKKLPAVPNVPPGTNEASGSIRLYRPYSKYFLSHWRLPRYEAGDRHEPCHTTGEVLYPGQWHVSLYGY